uniref:Uncharacterized protein n=1 Tax=Rhodnius prolixus TaxID=13249 RepID=T1I4B1_RHOPR
MAIKVQFLTDNLSSLALALAHVPPAGGRHQFGGATHSTQGQSAIPSLLRCPRATATELLPCTGHHPHHVQTTNAVNGQLSLKENSGQGGPQLLARIQQMGYCSK